MRPRKLFPEEAKVQLNTLLSQTKNVAEYRRIQSVWLRAALDMPIGQISKATGLAINTIRGIHSSYLGKGESALLGPGRGGWRYQNLPVSKEKELLNDFMFEAGVGGMIEVSKIKAAYEKQLGHSVPKSTIYRMLIRHDWRKLVPRPHHPKRNLARQEEFKKTYLPSSAQK